LARPDRSACSLVASKEKGGWYPLTRGRGVDNGLSDLVEVEDVNQGSGVFGLSCVAWRPSCPTSFTEAMETLTQVKAYSINIIDPHLSMKRAWASSNVLMYSRTRIQIA
jgi:hypothetical protein